LKPLTEEKGYDNVLLDSTLHEAVKDENGVMVE
jgi:hypothetical protein